ncbi:hypothetical protein A28LD_0986 [Idiomarina sp. A28L]|uniref:hypothetical protein n=1 Tax=Idiomarina sp. A28L TaxID=1036674 RepID=UPI0002138B8B|nr:hypothetical protein [Idiomarina sp. A28L]EGN75373.1 hypothetical protein A28LD_0986 [Idiomarina sp. A28L]
MHTNQLSKQLSKLMLVITACSFAANAAAQEKPLLLPVEEKTTDEQEKKDKTKLELNWLDGFQTGVETSVDNTARWIDNFFGNSRAFDGEYNSHGRLSIGPEWSQYDGWKVRSSFRAQFTLPNTEERFSAIIGRTNVDDFTVDEQSTYRGSVIRSDRGDEEWIVGLGFNPNQGEANRFSISAGIRGGLKADLYTQIRYLYQYRIDEDKQVRMRSNLFWRNSDGYGFNQRLDLEKSASPEWLSRFTIDATRAERIDGIRWHSSFAVYHLYDDERAIAGEIWYEGETKQEVPLTEWGIRAIHRRQFARDWLYLELSAGLHWPREELIQRREAQWLIGLEFEMWYGN